MPETVIIRPALLSDAADMLEIYTPYVLYTTASFEYVPPSQEEFAGRVEQYSQKFPWLLCEIGGIPVGYAYASPHKTRAAYQWTCEVSVYVREEYHRKRVASALYTALFDILKSQRIYIAYAGITHPNSRSRAFHERLGFEEIAVYRNTGYKFGAWHGVSWFEKVLLAPQQPPGRVLSMDELSAKKLEDIFTRAVRIIKL